MRPMRDHNCAPFVARCTGTPTALALSAVHTRLAAPPPDVRISFTAGLRCGTGKAKAYIWDDTSEGGVDWEEARFHIDIVCVFLGRKAPFLDEPTWNVRGAESNSVALYQAGGWGRSPLQAAGSAAGAAAGAAAGWGCCWGCCWGRSPEHKAKVILQMHD